MNFFSNFEGNLKFRFIESFGIFKGALVNFLGSL